MTQVDLPSSWIRYRNGLCEGCNAGCCTLPLEVSIDDLIQMGFAVEKESPKKLAKRLIAEGIVKYYRAATGLFTIQQKSNRDCIFLNRFRRCSIYEKRPSVCRAFPSIGPRPGYCPRQCAILTRK
jgi:uncharacterized protein